MLELKPAATSADASLAKTTVTLNYDQRTRSRLRITTDDGRSAGIYVERGHVLRDGELLQTGDGENFTVKAAPEQVSAVYTTDSLLMARLCYHLGNRHVALQVDAGRIAYQADHVLDDLVRGFGIEPVAEQAAFQPESGAYGHHHGHAHD